MGVRTHECTHEDSILSLLGNVPSNSKTIAEKKLRKPPQEKEEAKTKEEKEEEANAKAEKKNKKQM